MQSVSPAAGRLAAFVDAAPSPYHAVAEAAARLDAAGFTAHTPGDAWPAGASRGYIARGGNLVAWWVPVTAADRPETPFRIVGAHTDSPNLRVRPRPDTGRAGVEQVALEVYGGALLNSWLDRDLGLSGRVVVATDGADASVRLVRVDRPLLRVPQLAIHLDRDIGTTGLQLNPQAHLPAVWALGAPDEGAFARFLAKEVAVDEPDVVAWDVMTHDLTPAALLGRDDELLVSARLDNLCSAFAAVEGLVAAAGDPSPASPVAVIALFDHEEVGSESGAGAGGPSLATALERSVLARGGDREAFHRALAGSVCLSADMAHATHPNYVERHEPGHWISLDGGPALKTNANQRYATDAVSTAAFVAACEQAGVPFQRYAHRNDLPCGSTIGPITAARLGIATVDAGAPMLSMHSAREVMAAAGVAQYAAAVSAFLRPA